MAEVTIMGTNDQPVVQNVHFDTNEVDNGSQTFDGQLLLTSDDDVSDTHTFEIRSTNDHTTAHGGYEPDGTPNTVVQVGTDDNNNPIYAKVISDSEGLQNIALNSVTVDSDGQFHIAGDFNALAAGETATVRFRYVAVDDSGVGTNPAVGESDTSASRMAEVTIMGTNDAPYFILDNTNVEFVSESAAYNNVLGIYILDEFGNPTDPQIIMTDTNGGGDPVSSTLDLEVGSFGLFLIPNGDYDGIENAPLSFDLSGTIPQLIVDGSPTTAYYDNNAWNEGGKDHFDMIPNSDGSVEVRIEDLNLGDNDRNDLVVKLTPNVGDDHGTVIEIADGAPGENTATVSTSGVLEFDDLDLSDTHTSSITFSPDEDGYLGSFNANITDPATGAGDGEITWTFDVHDSYLDSMAEGETIVQTYTVNVTDNHGATASHDVVITIQGTNDAPVATADVNFVTEAGVDVPAAANLHGNVLDNDADVDHGASLAVVGIMSNNLGTDDSSFNSNDRLVLRGEYGRLSMDENGNYRYNLLDNDPDTNALKQGEEVNDVFTYRVSDGQGGFDTQTLTIHITGTNDAPVINESLSDTTALEFAGLNGEYYGVDTQIDNLAQFQSIVMSNNPDATFRATDISYGEHGVTTYPGISGGRDVSTAESLQTFLGDDANTLSRDPGNTSDGGVHMSGAVYLAAGTYNFQVTADDGYQITIDGNSVAEYAYNQSPTTQTHYYFTIENDGYHSVDMLWWDQGGEYVFQPQLRMGDGEYQTFSSENFAFRATAEASVIEAGTTDSGAEVAGVDMVIGTMVASDVDHDASLTWSVDDPDDTYGTFGIDANTGQWTYILDNSLAATDALEEGQRVTQTFNVVVTDEFGATDTQPVTITIQGTNDAPIATADVITKVTDHVEYDEVMMDAQVIGDGFELTTTSDDGMVWYGINDLHVDQDNQNLIDSKGSYNEGISFTLLGEAESATVSFKNANDNLQGNDNIAIALYLDHNLVANLDTSTIGNGAFTISGYGAFDEIRISAEDIHHGNTQFRVSQVVTADDVTLDTVLSFTIDDSMLLANDSDVDNHSDLSLVINDTSLYASDNSVIGTVGLDGDGNVVVTPDSIVEFNDDAQAYAHFNYSVVDEHGAQSDVVSATIDVALGTVTNNEGSYTEQTPQEFIIGTDEGTTPEAFAENVLVVSDTLNLSHVSDINTIQLESGAQVQGSGDGSPLAAITASDVISATDTDNTLVINSADTNATDQVSVDTSSLPQESVVPGDDGYYASYSDGDATLLIQIDDTLDVT